MREHHQNDTTIPLISALYKILDICCIFMDMQSVKIHILLTKISVNVHLVSKINKLSGFNIFVFVCHLSHLLEGDAKSLCHSKLISWYFMFHFALESERRRYLIPAMQWRITKFDWIVFSSSFPPLTWNPPLDLCVCYCTSCKTRNAQGRKN